MSARNSKKKRLTEIRNKKVFRDYLIEEKFEAGIVLKGTEVKALRGGLAQISDSFCRIEKGEVFLYGIHIDEYRFGNLNNHEPKRPRKLLLHKKQIRKIQHEMDAGGKSLIPLRCYLKVGLFKVEVALCTGKKLYDKREDLKKKAEMREVEKIFKYQR
ncbi:MAG: SsrA-binding protein SmpB [Opitutaceae bacterium]|nr:SsrA-binding protein SmpB [Opitutaceae bacterium]